MRVSSEISSSTGFKGVKRLVVLMSFLMHIPHKSYPHLVVQFIFLGPASNPVCKLPRQNVVHGLSTKPRFKIMRPLFIIACECQTMVIDVWSLWILMLFSQRSVMEMSMCRNLQLSRSHINCTSARKRPCPNGSSGLLYPMAMTQCSDIHPTDYKNPWGQTQDLNHWHPHQRRSRQSRAGQTPGETRMDGK